MSVILLLGSNDVDAAQIVERAITILHNSVGEVVRCVVEEGAQMFLCADHGNSDQMVDYETGKPHTAHTTNPVPLAVIGLPGNKKVKDV